MGWKFKRKKEMEKFKRIIKMLIRGEIVKGEFDQTDVTNNMLRIKKGRNWREGWEKLVDRVKSRKEKDALRKRYWSGRNAYS